MDWLESIVGRHPGKLLAAFCAATLLAVLQAAGGIEIDGSVEGLMMSDDPARELDRVAKAEFGNDEVLMVALDLGRPYDEAALRKLSAITEAIEELPGTDRVKSLANTEDIRGSEDELDASPLVDFDRLSEPFVFDAIQSRAADHRLYRDVLVSDAKDVLGVLVYADNGEANSEAMNDLTAAVIGVIDELAPPWEAYYAGYPVTAYEVNRIVKHDLALLTPVSLLVISAILIWFTRRLFPVALLIALAVWVESVAFAWLALNGIPINVVVSTLPTILLATSGTYVIYAVGLLAQASVEVPPGLALMRLVSRPVLLSGLSTGIGFGSLQFIDVEAIGDLGGALAVGILAATLGALLMLPAIVQCFGLRLEIRHHSGLQRLSQIGVAFAARPWRVMAVSAVCLALAIPGVLRLTVHTDTLDYFQPDNFVRVGADFFLENLSSAFLMNFVIRSDEEGRVMDPDVLEFADSAIGALESMPHVDRTVSMLDYFYLMDQALRPDGEATSNPGSRQAAAQYLLLYESSGDPEDYERYINFDRSALSLVASAHGGSSRYIEATKVVEELAAEAPPDITVESLGTMYLYSRAMDSMTRGMLRGLAVALVLVGVVMLVGLRSFDLAAIAALPNIAPLLICAGALGWAGLPLSMATSLVGCIALGLAVDDTAHVMGHLDRDEALESVFRLVGPPVLLTTCALGLGFLCLVLSDFRSVQSLGIATAVTLGIALVADLLVLPSLLVLIGYTRTEKELRAR
mgnify:CR=1 FL=1